MVNAFFSGQVILKTLFVFFFWNSHLTRYPVFSLKNLEKASPVCFSSTCLEHKHNARRCGSCLVTMRWQRSMSMWNRKVTRVASLTVSDTCATAWLWSSSYRKSNTKHSRSLLDWATVERAFVVLQLTICAQGSYLSWASCLVPNTMTAMVLPLWKDKEMILNNNNKNKINNKWVIRLFPCILSRMIVPFLFILGRILFPFEQTGSYRGVLFAMQNKSIFKTLECLDS